MSLRPIIVIAGWGHPASVMSGLCDALAYASGLVAVSTHDLTLRDGCSGRSTCPAKGGIERRRSRISGMTCASSYASGLVSLIQEQGGTAILMGWSMGGLVALETASRYPEKVSRLVLVSTTPKFCSGEGYSCGMPMRNVRAMSLGVKRDPGKTLAGFYQLAAAPFAEPVTTIRDHGRQAAGWTDDLAAGLNYLMTTDLREHLNRIQTPVLMLHGREDRVIPWQAADLARCALPDSRLCLYDRLGHDLPLREPEQLAAEIRRFLLY